MDHPWPACPIVTGTALNAGSCAQGMLMVAQSQGRCVRPKVFGTGTLALRQPADVEVMVGAACAPTATRINRQLPAAREVFDGAVYILAFCIHGGYRTRKARSGNPEAVDETQAPARLERFGGRAPWDSRPGAAGA